MGNNAIVSTRVAAFRVDCDIATGGCHIVHTSVDYQRPALPSYSTVPFIAGLFVTEADNTSSHYTQPEAEYPQAQTKKVRGNVR
jgi:hypothetical protein